MEHFEKPPRPAQEQHEEEPHLASAHETADGSEAPVEHEADQEAAHATQEHTAEKLGGTREAYKTLVEEIKTKEGSFFSGEGARNEMMKELEKLAQELSREDDHFHHELEKAFERGLKGDLGRTEFRWTDQVFLTAFEQLEANHPQGH